MTLPIHNRRQTEDALSEVESALDRQTGTVEIMTKRVSCASLMDAINLPTLISISTDPGRRAQRDCQGERQAQGPAGRVSCAVLLLLLVTH